MSFSINAGDGSSFTEGSGGSVNVHTWRDRGFLSPAVAARGVRASSEGNLRK